MELHTEGGGRVTYSGWEFSYKQRVGMELHTVGGNGVTYRGWK